MPHQRLLDALDSSSPLLFIEAISGSGKRTVLQQWEQHGSSRHGEIRLRFNARRLPPEPSALSRIFWSALRHRLRQDLPVLPADDSQLEEAMLGHLRDIRRPIAVAVHGADVLGPPRPYAYGMGAPSCRTARTVERGLAVAGDASARRPSASHGGDAGADRAGGPCAAPSPPLTGRRETSASVSTVGRTLRNRLR